MANDLDSRKWAVVKNILSLVRDQQSLITSLCVIADAHHAILRGIAERMGIELPEELPPVDPEAIRKMNQGLLELEKMFRDEDPQQPPQANA